MAIDLKMHIMSVRSVIVAEWTHKLHVTVVRLLQTLSLSINWPNQQVDQQQLPVVFRALSL